MRQTVSRHDAEQRALRRELHRYPDLSNQEGATAARLRQYLEPYGPDRIATGIGGSGMMAVFGGESPGPRIAFRAELDALPIEESLPLDHGSVTKGVSHKCGHDGHMAIVAGLAPHLAERRPLRGEVILLFQPAEETGEGAARIVAAPVFQDLAPDRIYALHNLPGFELGTVVVRDGVFASGSLGLIVRLHGVTSHAGEPERGVSPARAAAAIIEFIASSNDRTEPSTRPESGAVPGTLATVIHVRVGEPAFGVTPGYGEVMATLRSPDPRALARLTEEIEAFARETGVAHGLRVEVERTEEFRATVNDVGCVEVVRSASRTLGMNVMVPDLPFRWSEDFGRFTEVGAGVLFGLGSGADQPALHRPEYDFPDDLLEPATRLFLEIVNEELGLPFA
ncbi:MAG: amidohydrolase [Candidatus Eisenbacteria bacterium]